MEETNPDQSSWLGLEPEAEPESALSEAEPEVEDDEVEVSGHSYINHRVIGLNGAEDVKEEKLIQLSHLPNDRIDINYDKRLSLPSNKDLKKRLKEKVLKNNKGKLITDYKRKYSVDSNRCTFVPADMLMLLKEDHDLANFKSVIISYFKEKNFTVDIKPTNGGEQITIKSDINEDGKQSPLKIPIKLYHRNKKIMIQGCEKSQEDFLKFYVSYKTDFIKEVRICFTHLK